MQTFLGLDTAQSNLGVVLLSWDGSEVDILHARTFKPVNRLSDILINAQVANYLRDILKNNSAHLTAAALESPAYAFKHQMVSIGTIHGVLGQFLADMKIPFMYVTPNKVKYFAAGPATGGPWKKAKIISQVVEGFGVGKHEIDDNVADAAVLATIALCGAHVNFHHTAPAKNGVLPTPWQQDWANFVLFGSAKGTKGRPDGLLQRPGEFLFRNVGDLLAATPLTKDSPLAKRRQGRRRQGLSR